MKTTHLELFKTLAAKPDAKSSLKDALLILGTPRCGSTLFAEVLNNTGQLGYCDEWFNESYFEAWKQVTGQEFDIETYMNWIVRKTIGDTGVLCIKLLIGQLISVNTEYNVGLESFNFKQIVYLYRHNKIAQSVSLAYAVATDKFRSYEPDPEDEPDVNVAKVADALNIIVRQDQFVRGHLWKYVAASYAYEKFSRFKSYDVEGPPIYNKVLDTYGKPPQSAFSAGRLKIQRTAETQGMCARFRRYIGE